MEKGVLGRIIKYCSHLVAIQACSCVVAVKWSVCVLIHEQTKHMDDELVDILLPSTGERLHSHFSQGYILNQNGISSNTVK